MKGKEEGLMQKIVVDIQNFLFADSIAAAFRNSDYDIVHGVIDKLGMKVRTQTVVDLVMGRYGLVAGVKE